ncbi:MAG: hypothetical protein Fur0032_11790 [Terrimicrobiaceae bacterium]
MPTNSPTRTARQQHNGVAHGTATQAPDTLITTEDANSIVALVADNMALKGHHVFRKTHFADGLKSIVGADAWLWTMPCTISPGRPQIYAGLYHGGFDEERFVKLLLAMERPEAGKLMEPLWREVVRTGRQATMNRTELDPEGLGSTGCLGAAWNAADIGSLIVTYVPVDESRGCGLGFYRRLQDPSFGVREKTLIHLAVGAVPWLHDEGWPDDLKNLVLTLSPRVRTVMGLLADGQKREAISNHLGLSLHTVNDYVKEIYRHFGVSSQAALQKTISGAAAL